MKSALYKKVWARKGNVLLKRMIHTEHGDFGRSWFSLKTIQMPFTLMTNRICGSAVIIDMHLIVIMVKV